MLAQIKAFFDRHLMPGGVGGPAEEEYRLRLAVAALLLEMTRADDEVSALECAALDAGIRDHFGLTDHEARELIALAEAERRAATELLPVHVTHQCPLRTRTTGPDRGAALAHRLCGRDLAPSRGAPGAQARPVASCASRGLYRRQASQRRGYLNSARGGILVVMHPRWLSRPRCSG